MRVEIILYLPVHTLVVKIIRTLKIAQEKFISNANKVKFLHKMSFYTRNNYKMQNTGKCKILTFFP